MSVQQKTKVKQDVKTANSKVTITVPNVEDHVIVTDGVDDEKKRKEVIMVMKNALRGRRGKKGVGKLKSTKVWLWYSFTHTSSATSTQAPVDQLFAGSSAEAASLADLFDEFKVLKGHVIFQITGSLPSNGYDIIAAYDPANAGAFGSVVAALPSAYHKLVAASGSSIQPIPYANDGHWHFKFTMPKGSFTDAGGASATGDWSDTTNISANDYGFVKWFVGQPTAGTSTVFGHIGLLTEFRMRS